MKVYGDMEDMVNKILLFTSKYVPLAWEPGTARLIEKLSKESSFSIIAGSHIGYYPLIVGYTNPMCKVYAFEPNPINYKRCVYNVDLNNLKNVKVIEKALGKVIGKEKMYFDFGQSSFVDSKRKHHACGLVQVTTIDSLVTDFDGQTGIIILDAEGYEKNIIDGGINYISKDKPTIVFELNKNALKSAGTSSMELCNLLKGIGYNIYVISEGSHGISFNSDIKIKLIPYEDYVLSEASFVNALAIMNSEKINQYVYKK